MYNQCTIVREETEMSAVSVKGLSKSFSYYEKQSGLGGSFKNLFGRKTLYREAVKGISFEIDEGEFVGFLGPNGAGKTTTLKMLSGILFPTAGEAQVSGFTPWERKKTFKMGLSIVMGQKNQLWWDLPAIDSFYLNKCIYEIDNIPYQKMLDELTELLDVKQLLNIQVRRLSLGERMKMELIAALLHRPKILFLDEPTIGLDIISQKKIREFLKFFNEQNKTTIMLTSHYMQDIEDLCERAIIINHGEIVFDGTLARVNDCFSGKKIVRLQLSNFVDESVLKTFPGFKSTEGQSVTYEVVKDNVRDLSRRMLTDLPVADLTIEDIPVEEGIALLYQSGGTK